MASQTNSAPVSEAESAADGRADAVSAILLVAIAVATAVLWISGH